MSWNECDIVAVTFARNEQKMEGMRLNDTLARAQILKTWSGFSILPPILNSISLPHIIISITISIHCYFIVYIIYHHQ